jgi:hypothetical protein
LAECDGGCDPLVVGLLESLESGVLFERKDGVAVFDATVEVQAGQEARLRQFIFPALQERFSDLCLGIAVGRESGAD